MAHVQLHSGLCEKQRLIELMCKAGVLSMTNRPDELKATSPYYVVSDAL